MVERVLERRFASKCLQLLTKQSLTYRQRKTRVLLLCVFDGEFGVEKRREREGGLEREHRAGRPGQARDRRMNASSDAGPLIKLISAEGHEFYVHKKCAMVSGTIKMMLSGQFAESRGEVRFPEIPGIILERVVQYLYYKVRYTNSSQRVPNFSIEPEMSLELLIAANYLDC